MSDLTRPGVSSACSTSRTDPWRGVALAGVLGLALIAYTSGYRGVIFDAELYAFQASARLSPEDLAGDLFLRYGSQDSYSAFSVAYAPLIQILGLTNAALLVAAVSLLLLFAATYYLFAFKREASAALAGTLAVAVWPVAYSAESILQVARFYSTPRPLACAAGILAIAFAMGGRCTGAVIAAGVALLVHPLMAAPALLLLGLTVVRPTRLLLIALIIAAMLLAGAMAGMPLLDRLLLVIDPDWKGVVLERSPFLSALRWSPGDWSLVGVAVLSPLLAGMRLDDPLRRLFIASSVVGALGVAATLVLSDLAGSVLAMQIQPWRTLWVSHWLGVAGIGLLLVQYDEHRERADLIALLGLIGAELTAANTGAVVLGIALWAALVQRAATPGPWSGLSYLATLVAAGQALCWYVAGFPSTVAFSALESGSDSFLPWALRNPGLVGATLIVGFLARKWIPPSFRDLVRWAAAGAAMIVGAINIERTVTAEVGQMSLIAEPKAVVRALPRDGSVLWGESGRVAWFVLGYPSYISIMQTAGIVFSRATALEASRRAEHIESVLGEQMFMRWRAGKVANKPIDAKAVVALCTDPALSAVFVPGEADVASSVPIRGQHGSLIGRLALCPEGRRGGGAQ